MKTSSPRQRLYQLQSKRRRPGEAQEKMRHEQFVAAKVAGYLH
jgi:hypothetical protein